VRVCRWVVGSIGCAHSCGGETGGPSRSGQADDNSEDERGSQHVMTLSGM